MLKHDYSIAPVLSEQRIQAFYNFRSAGDIAACWPWHGATSKDGYGYFWSGKRPDKAHRIAFYLATGRWPQQFVLHKCDNPPCVNPEHLFEGSNADNIRDRVCKARSAVGKRNGRYTMPERTPRGEQRFNAKVNTEAVQEMRQLYAAGGYTYAQLGRRYGLHKSTVTQIINRLIWKHI